MKAFVKTVWSWVRRKPTALSYIRIHRFGLMDGHALPWCREDRHWGSACFNSHLTVYPIGRTRPKCPNHFLDVPGKFPWQLLLPAGAGSNLPVSSPGGFFYHQVETESSLLTGRFFTDSRGSLFDLESPSEVGYSSDCQTRVIADPRGISNTQLPACVGD